MGASAHLPSGIIFPGLLLPIFVALFDGTPVSSSARGVKWARHHPRRLMVSVVVWITGRDTGRSLR